MVYLRIKLWNAYCLKNKILLHGENEVLGKNFDRKFHNVLHEANMRRETGWKVLSVLFGRKVDKETLWMNNILWKLKDCQRRCVVTRRLKRVNIRYGRHAISFKSSGMEEPFQYFEVWISLHKKIWIYRCSIDCREKPFSYRFRLR